MYILIRQLILCCIRHKYKAIWQFIHMFIPCFSSWRFAKGKIYNVFHGNKAMECVELTWCLQYFLIMMTGWGWASPAFPFGGKKHCTSLFFLPYGEAISAEQSTGTGNTALLLLHCPSRGSPSLSGKVAEQMRPSWRTDHLWGGLCWLI